MEMKEDCIFCKLANGVFDTNTLYEDKDFRVIFDASPATVGHVLILPKEHSANVFELPDDTAAKVFVLAKKIATVLKQVTGCDGVNILQNNGEEAGQTVFHFHMHIIPRYKDGDDKDIIKWEQKEADQQAINEIIEKAKAMI